MVSLVKTLDLLSLKWYIVPMSKPINTKCLTCHVDFTPNLRETHINYTTPPSCWVPLRCTRLRNYYKYLEVKRKKQRENHSYIKYSDTKCALCRREDSLEAHHIIPQAEGGKDLKNNIMTLCSDCHKVITRYINASKSIRKRAI